MIFARRHFLLSGFLKNKATRRAHSFSIRKLIEKNDSHILKPWIDIAAYGASYVFQQEGVFGNIASLGCNLISGYMSMFLSKDFWPFNKFTLDGA